MFGGATSEREIWSFVIYHGKLEIRRSSPTHYVLVYVYHSHYIEFSSHSYRGGLVTSRTIDNSKNAATSTSNMVKTTYMLQSHWIITSYHVHGRA